MRRMVLRAMCWKSTSALVVISPASTTRLSFTSVSAATRERLSWARIASSTASEIWSATLSGWPSDTDSEVKRKSLIARAPSYGRPQGYQNLATVPQRGAPADREIAAAIAARVGKRPRLGALWDVAHLSSPDARQPAPGRVRRRAHAQRGGRFGGSHARRAARAVVPAARRGGRAGARSGGRRAGARGARCRQAAAVPHAAHGLLRGDRAVRRAACPDHRALPAAQARLARSAHARRARPAQ